MIKESTDSIAVKDIVDSSTSNHQAGRKPLKTSDENEQSRRKKILYKNILIPKNFCPQYSQYPAAVAKTISIYVKDPCLAIPQQERS